jgi:hypothetical protein
MGSVYDIGQVRIGMCKRGKHDILGGVLKAQSQDTDTAAFVSDDIVDRPPGVVGI